MIRFRLFLLLDALLMALPRSWRKWLFTALASLAHRFAKKRNRVIRQNLTFAFQDTLNEAQIDEIERYCYRNLALNVLQIMENRRNDAEKLAKQVTFENREKLDAVLAEGRGVIFISAHFGNWEIGATALASLVTPVTAIYKGLDRPEFDPYLLEARSRHRLEMIEKDGALKHLAKALKGRKAVSLLIDQASNARHGVKVNFFGHPTYHSSTPAILSYKYNAPIVALYILTHDEEHYTIRFEDPIEVRADDPESILEATQAQVTTLERIIRAHPKFWFWLHKRWKGEFPELYRK
ncbi:MAG: lipid A biosynthesis acyltransferase [Campylobacterales bacterium]|nr:lipid A biosynthesis acyltransferase [Campylobacterales bacterium]